MVDLLLFINMLLMCNGKQVKILVMEILLYVIERERTN